MRLKQQKFDSLPEAVFSVTALKKLMSDVLSLREQVAQAELEKGQYSATHQKPGGEPRAAG
jgi:hypothetical protein